MDILKKYKNYVLVCLNRFLTGSLSKDHYYLHKGNNTDCSKQVSNILKF